MVQRHLEIGGDLVKAAEQYSFFFAYEEKLEEPVFAYEKGFKYTSLTQVAILAKNITPGRASTETVLLEVRK